MEGLRRCCVCNELLPLENFRRRGPSGGSQMGKIYGCCKNCNSKRSAEITSHHAIYVKEVTRARGSKTKHLWRICTLEVLLLWYLQDGRCAITGKPMTTQRGLGQHVPTNMSIDRIDNDGDYVWGNIQLVCDVINRMKQTLTLSELIEWCEAVIGTTKSKELDTLSV